MCDCIKLGCYYDKTISVLFSLHSTWGNFKLKDFLAAFESFWSKLQSCKLEMVSEISELSQNIDEALGIWCSVENQSKP